MLCRSAFAINLIVVIQLSLYSSSPNRSNTNAQDSSSYKLFSKQNRASYILSAVAGLSDGVSDANFFHHAFRGSQYADFYLSWRNKYKNGDPAQGERFFGSTTFLVWGDYIRVKANAC